MFVECLSGIPNSLFFYTVFGDIQYVRLGGMGARHHKLLGCPPVGSWFVLLLWAISEQEMQTTH